ncbi:hypothetical protein DyAD56_16120 [Dyella sp. AD56]|uniref:hypothetical protein n=1 Tax=Dyella sp. AD56 TaxID=1528744 RepID=UPI000C818905|nr:hypothetical protein [Dyella sp. AD56]PMQ04215.1 hypothetical protein DyAD56_16120 [Dyella sp. AD56]
MARITGEFDGYTYEAIWDLPTDHRILWNAKVRNSRGDIAGTPGGSILVLGDASELSNEESVRQTVATAIGGGVGVDREV